MSEDKIKTAPVILIATGASGGHICPALAVADELQAQGCECVFVGGGKNFSRMMEEAGYRHEELPVSPWNVSSLPRKLWAIANLWRALWKAMRIVHRIKPSVVFGTGGYATVAAVIAGRLSGVPTMVQEQNVLPGRANKLLFRHVDKIALSFDPLPGMVPPSREAKMVVCGNPLRRVVVAAGKVKRVSDKTHLLVTGGSQGARILSDVVPQAIALLDKKHVGGLHVSHQARPEDVERVTQVYRQAGVSFDVNSFYENLPEMIQQARLVIARAGAGTVFEVAFLNRAAIYVPLKLADGHQRYNAQAAVQQEAAIMIEEDSFSAENLAAELSALLEHPEKIDRMEKCAASFAKPGAAEAVAKEVLSLAMMDVMTMAQPARQDDEEKRVIHEQP